MKWIFFTLATFIERYDSFHGTTAHKGGETKTETKTGDTEEVPVETDSVETATPEKSEGGDGTDKAETKEATEKSRFLDSFSMYN